jgi:hypothetical protein
MAENVIEYAAARGREEAIDHQFEWNAGRRLRESRWTFKVHVARGDADE